MIFGRRDIAQAGTWVINGAITQEMLRHFWMGAGK